jgi:hypothetical protein
MKWLRAVYNAIVMPAPPPRPPAVYISLVMLRRRPRPLTLDAVRDAARRVFGRAMDVEAGHIGATGEDRGFALMAPGNASLGIVEADTPYTNDPRTRAPLEWFAWKRANDAIAAHRSWMNVLYLVDQPRDPAAWLEHRRVAGRFLAVFVDDDSLAFVEPGRNGVALMGPEAAEALRSGDPGFFYAANGPEPLSPSEDHEPVLIKAKEEVVRRLPEFEAACSATRTPEQWCDAQAAFETLEGRRVQVWVRVRAVTDDGFEGVVLHAGPGAGLPAVGDTVTIKKERVIDWMYLIAPGKVVGPLVDTIRLERVRTAAMMGVRETDIPLRAPR